jgi:hypothetical protein
VLETLMRIKRKDPVVYQKDVVLFPAEPDADADEEAAAEQKKEKGSSKPMYLRTVLAKQVGAGIDVGVYLHDMSFNSSSWACRCAAACRQAAAVTAWLALRQQRSQQRLALHVAYCSL